MIKWKAMWMIMLILALGLAVMAPECDDDDDDDNDDDNDDEEPDSYILTSDYGDQYFVFNGDNYSLIDVYKPLAEGMHSLEFATLVPGIDGMKVVFRSKPAAGGHAEMFSADAFADTNLHQMTTLESEGLADTVPAGDLGVAFIGVRSGSTQEVLTMQPEGTEPNPYKTAAFQKVLIDDPCVTAEWASPAFSPDGELFAAGWFGKDQTGAEVPSYTTVLAFNVDEEECGDPLYLMEGYQGIQDVCFTSDSSMVLFSIGAPNLTLEIYAAKVDGSEDPVDVSAAFNNGDIDNFDCDPTSMRVVFNTMEVNPNLLVMDYEITDGSISFGEAEQITTDSTFRRPRWVAN